MSPVALSGFLLSFLAIAFGWIAKKDTAQLGLLIALFVMHLAACFFYYRYSITNVSDAFGYYYYSYFIAGEAFGLGTVFTDQFVRFLKVDLGASYLDCFLFFQAIGFAGLTILVRVIGEIQEKVGNVEHRRYLGLLFFPSVNFWTAAVGKDAPLFFSISLSTWAILNFRKRIVFFCAALGVMTLFRPHIALMAAAAVAGASSFGSSISVGRRLGLLAVSAAALAVGMVAVQSEFGVDVTSTSSVTSFLDKQNEIYATVSGSTSLGNAPYPVRVLSLLFRPFFFDAKNAMAIVASLENVAVLLAFFFLIRHIRDIRQLARHVFFIRYVLLLTLFILGSLTLVYYNVGLGLRQRVMAFPTFASLLVAVWAMKRKTAAQRVEQLRAKMTRTTSKTSLAPEL